MIKLKIMIELIKSDLYRNSGKKDYSNLYRLFYCICKHPWVKCLLYYRLCHYMRQKNILKYSIYPIFKILKYHNESKYGIYIDVRANISGGLRIAHPQATFISKDIYIGKNCTITQGVLFGWVNRGIYYGVPKSVGDNVYIGPGVKILGHISIGNNVIIGANSVVQKNIPDNVVISGIPARIISKNNSLDSYCTNTIDF